MAQQVFRQQALERLSSPEQLDRVMSLTSPRQWVALAGAGLLLAVALVWACWGTIATTIEADGVLTRPGGVATARAGCSGIVDQILVSVGDRLRGGQELAWIRPAVARSPTERMAVLSPCDGRLFNMGILEGDLVEEGEFLAAVENPERPLAAVVFIPAREVHRVPPDAEAQVTLGSARERNTHPLLGRVGKVGRFPVSHNALGRTLQSMDWATSMVQYGPVLEVVIELTAAARNESLVCGIPCRARITVARRPPIQLLLGMFPPRQGR